LKNQSSSLPRYFLLGFPYLFRLLISKGILFQEGIFYPILWFIFREKVKSHQEDQERYTLSLYPIPKGAPRDPIFQESV
jgi:hypothetical protein